MTGKKNPTVVLFVTSLLFLALVPAFVTSTAEKEVCTDPEDLEGFEYDVDTAINGETIHECRHIVIRAAVTVADGGSLVLDRSELTVEGAGSLEVEAGGSLRFIATAYDMVNRPFTVTEGGSFESFLLVNVTADVPEGESAQGALVWAWDGDGKNRIDGALDAQERVQLNLPLESITPQGSALHLPWRISASHTIGDGPVVDVQEILVAPENSGPLGLPPMQLVADNLDNEDPHWPAEGVEWGTQPFVNTPSIILSWEAAADDRGVDHYEVEHNGALLQTVGATSLHVSDLEQGEHSMRVRPVDLADRKGPWSDPFVLVADFTRPQATLNITGTPGLLVDHYRDQFNVSANVTDTVSGIDRVEICLSPGSCETVTDLESLDDPGHQVDEEGVHNGTLRVRDRAGNERVLHFNATLDSSPPDLELRFNPPLPTGQRGWYHRAPTVTINAQDVGPAGLHEVGYRLDPDANWTTYTGPFVVNASGDHLLEARAMDRAGNVAAAMAPLPVDLKPPVLNVQTETPAGPTGWYNGPVRVLVEAEDDASGVQTLAYRIGGGAWTPFEDPLVLNHSGSRELFVRATDRAGNPSEEVRRAIRIDDSPPIPPEPRWMVLEDGRVEMDWMANPPQDLVSGIARAVVERGAPDGNVTNRIEVSTDQAVHTVGPFPTGAHRFRVTVEDHAGNVAQGPWAEFTISNSVAFLTTATGSNTVRGMVPLTFTPTEGFEAVEVRFLVNGAEVATMDAAPFIFEWNTRNHPDGSHSVRAIARDAAGQEQVEEQVFQVRNAYSAVLADHSVPVVAGALLLVASAAIGTGGLRQWRRWEA